MAQEKGGPVWVDPGWNDDAKSKLSQLKAPQGPPSKSNQVKKQMKGPGMSKNKDPVEEIKPPTQSTGGIGDELLGLDLLGGGGSQAPPGQAGQEISFEDMLGMQNRSANNNNSNNTNAPPTGGSGFNLL